MGKHHWYDHDGALADWKLMELGCHLAAALGDFTF